MKNFLLRFLLATAATVLTFALSPSLHAQLANQDPTPAATQQPQQNEAQMPSSGDTTTQDAKTFSGRIVKENGDLVLMDPVTKVSYKLSDPTKAKPYIGKQVKVTGKLDMSSNTINVERIELLS
jgi:hypothetical protein